MSVQGRGEGHAERDEMARIRPAGDDHVAEESTLETVTHVLAWLRDRGKLTAASPPPEIDEAILGAVIMLRACGVRPVADPRRR